MNKRKLTYSMFFILLFTLAVIGGSNQAAQALYSNQPVDNQELQEVDTTPVVDETGLNQKENTIDIWIEQDYEIVIYETAYMECHILNLFAIDINVEIEVWIQYSNGSVFLIYSETKLLHPYIEYVFVVTHSFTLIGYHLVNLKVMDVSQGMEYTTECQWYVYDGFVEYTLYQDFEAQVGIEVNMTVFIQNGFAIAKYYYFELLLDDGAGPVQIYEDTILIAAYDVYIVVVPWIFAVAGHYDVILRIYDLLADKEYFDYCYWEVYDGFIDIIIEQNYETWVGIEERMQVWVYNYYLIDVSADISVWITNGTLDILIYVDFSVLLITGSYVMIEIYYTFIYEGYWDLYVEVYVVDNGLTWIEYCPEGWYVYSGYLEVFIYQQYEVFVFEEAIMYCWVVNNYLVDRAIAIEVWISNATDEILIYGETYVIAAGEIYDFTVFWTFLYPDYWDVKLVVTDLRSGEIFVDYCWWYVYGGYMDLYIYQQNYGLIYQEVLMTFEIYNYFAEQHNVSIQVLIFDGIEYIEIYYNAVSLEAFDFFVFEIWYLFEIAGYYDVILVVTDLATGEVWIEYCWWYIYAEYLDLWIIQAYKAQVGEEVLMEFYIFNYYSISMDLTVNVWIFDGTNNVLIFTDSIIIPANGVYNFSVLYTFMVAGGYTVTLEVIDNNTGAHWFKECRWKIYEGYIDVWIEQDYDAVVGEEVWMEFYIKNYYNYDVQLFLEVRIDTGNGIIVLFQDAYFLLLATQLWMIALSYTFQTAGIYQVYFIVAELQTSAVWTSECRWYIHDDGWFDVWIEQQYYGEVGQNCTMQFGVGNYYSVEKILNLVVKIVHGSDSWIAHNESRNVLAMTTYSFYVYWIFYDEGWYDVYFIVTEYVTGNVIVKDCWWKIEKPIVVPEFTALSLLPILGALSAAVLLALRRKMKINQ